MFDHEIEFDVTREEQYELGEPMPVEGMVMQDEVGAQDAEEPISIEAGVVRKARKRARIGCTLDRQTELGSDMFRCDSLSQTAPVPQFIGNSLQKVFC